MRNFIPPASRLAAGTFRCRRPAAPYDGKGQAASRRVEAQAGLWRTGRKLTRPATAKGRRGPEGLRSTAALRPAEPAAKRESKRRGRLPVRQEPAPACRPEGLFLLTGGLKSPTITCGFGPGRKLPRLYFPPQPGLAREDREARSSLPRPLPPRGQSNIIALPPRKAETAPARNAGPDCSGAPQVRLRPAARQRRRLLCRRKIQGPRGLPPGPGPLCVPKALRGPWPRPAEAGAGAGDVRARRRTAPPRSQAFREAPAEGLPREGPNRSSAAPPAKPGAA
jgi:hypothetical protein